LLIFGFVGNTLIFLTVHYGKFSKTVAGFHFKALAIADQFSSLDMVHVILMQAAPQWIYPWGHFFCKEHLFSSYTSYSVAAWCVVALTVDRFAAVCFPLKAQTWCTKKKAKIFLFLNVAIHLMINAPRAVFREFHTPNESDLVHDMCRVVTWASPSYENTQEFIYHAVDVILPCSLVVAANTGILVKIRRTNKETLKLGRPKSDDGGTTAMLLIMSFAFVVFMTSWPIDFIYWTVLHPEKADDDPEFRSFIFSVTIVLVICNNQFNFYIYLLASSSFRKDFKRLCRRIFKCRTTTHTRLSSVKFGSARERGTAV
jgi:hypothetical protein